MAKVYTRKCDICGDTALKRDSFLINPSSSTKRYLVCSGCGKTLSTFLKKNGLLKTVHPRSLGSRKARKLKTRRK